MKYKVSPIEKHHMKDAIGLLQRNLSDYSPCPDQYDEIWNSFSAQNNIYSIVILDADNVVGYGSILIETKIRGGKMGHIEDIVTHENFRGLGIGKLIIESLLVISQNNNCYKVALQTLDQNSIFYSKLGFTANGITMQKF